MANSSRLLFITLGDKSKASSRVRAYWIAQELQAYLSVRLMHGHALKKFLAFAWHIALSEVVIFQKCYGKYHLLLIKWGRLLGKQVFLDIDDSPSRNNNPATLKYFKACAQAASGVLAGSPFLVEYVRQFQPLVHYWPTGVRTRNYKVKTDFAAPLTIGWIGNGPHYKQDLLEILKPVVMALAQQVSFKLKIIGLCGDAELSEAFKAVPGLKIEWVDQLNWEDPSAIRQGIQEFDIGVYPLQRNEFNQYKCGFKALEYMASGLPTIASANSANSAIIQSGKTGFIADTLADWRDKLMLLLQQKQLVKEMGEKARLRAENHYDTAILAKQLLVFTKLETNHPAKLQTN